MVLPWILFCLFIISCVIVDLKIFHKKDKIETVRDSAFWSFVWISLALVFNGILYFWIGKTEAIQYITAYIVEKSLSVDNLFVFLMIFKTFQIAQKYQHRVLFWGILGALIMRAGMIFIGASLIETFHFTIYFFGAFLIFTGVKILFQGERKFEFRKGFLSRLIHRLIPITHKVESHHFFIKEKSKYLATPLFVALIMIELSDIVFAVDSIPAVLAISTNPFIIYTSNIFAILGLRSLYFLLASLTHTIRFLDTGLSYILIFVGTKMVISSYIKVPILFSLGVIVSILIISVIASYVWPLKKKKH